MDTVYSGTATPRETPAELCWLIHTIDYGDIRQVVTTRLEGYSARWQYSSRLQRLQLNGPRPYTAEQSRLTLIYKGRQLHPDTGKSAEVVHTLRYQNERPEFVGRWWE